MVRQLTEDEINLILSNKHINKIAVKEFLSKVHNYNSVSVAVHEFLEEAKKKKYNTHTCDAIRKGISMALKK